MAVAVINLDSGYQHSSLMIIMGSMDWWIASQHTREMYNIRSWFMLIIWDPTHNDAGNWEHGRKWNLKSVSSEIIAHMDVHSQGRIAHVWLSFICLTTEHPCFTLRSLLVIIPSYSPLLTALKHQYATVTVNRQKRLPRRETHRLPWLTDG